jgi:hypothetical protein
VTEAYFFSLSLPIVGAKTVSRTGESDEVKERKGKYE